MKNIFSILLCIVFFLPMRTNAQYASSYQICDGQTRDFHSVFITPDTLPSGGFWYSSNIAIATVDSFTGFVTGVNTGTVDITYDASSGISIVTLTVNPQPIVSGPSTVCVGTVVHFTSTLTGGTWILPSSDATIDSAGYVLGISPSPSVVVVYSLPTGCTGTTSIDLILGLPPIPGASSICVGQSLTMSDTISGGYWTSSDTTIAKFTDSVLLGLTAGTVTVTYTDSISCGWTSVYKTVTVNPNPIITYLPTNLCVGDTVYPVVIGTDITWSLANTNAGFVGSSGIKGNTRGLETVTFTNGFGCSTTGNIRIESAVSPIIGDSVVCKNFTSVYTDSVVGGYWTSSDTGKAYFFENTLYGNGTGTLTITYTDSNSCGWSYTTKTLTINNSPGAITAPSYLCMGSTGVATDSTSSGYWTAYFGNISVDALGNLTPVTLGYDSILYTYANGCTASVVIDVTTLPSHIVGDSLVCSGSTATFIDSITDGVWLSSDSFIAIISGTMGNGILSASGVGSVNISYTNNCGTSVKHITVNTIPSISAISGLSTVCQGAHISLSDSFGGGTWRSLYESVATISSGGVVTGVSGGVDLLFYTRTNYCGSDSNSFFITVNPLPNAGAITGADTICQDGFMTLTDTTYTNSVTTGWTISNTSLSVVSAGVFFGNYPGLDTIKFKVTNSCGSDSVLWTLNVSPLPAPAPLTGADSVCPGYSISLSETVPGGVWSSANASIAVVTFGEVYAVSSGIDTIEYTITNGCGTIAAQKVITVNLLPNAGTIFSADSVCMGQTFAYSETESTGAWGLTNDHVLFTTDSLIGNTTGLDTLVYTVINGCGTAFALKPVWVYAPPDAGVITGPDSVCLAATIVLHDSVAGGTWNSLYFNASVTNGVVTGNLNGWDTITYSISFCGVATVSKAIKIVSIPYVGSIMGQDTLCLGGITVLTDSSVGGIGIWRCTNGVASVVNGTVTGLAAGIDTVIYKDSNICGSFHVELPVYVIVTPHPSISGKTNVCVNAKDTLIGTPDGGTWTLENATIGSLSANVFTANLTGTDVVKYKFADNCGSDSTTFIIVIDSTLSPNIIGRSYACINKPDTLYSSPAGGMWANLDTSIANVTATGTTAYINAIGTGIDTVYYVMINSCGTFYSNQAVELYPQQVCDSINFTPEVNSVKLNELRVYPNPNQGSFSVEFFSENTINELVIELTNLIGQVVYKETFKPEAGINKRIITLNNDVVNGLYLFSVQSNDSVRKVRIIVDRY